MIKLIVEVDKDINDFTKSELNQIHWDSLQKDIIRTINPATYKKLPSEGRTFACRFNNLYDEKPIEYWNEVFKFKPFHHTFVKTLLSNAKNPKQMIDNHTAYFKKYMSLSLRMQYGLAKFSEYLSEHGYGTGEMDCYEMFLSPTLPVEFYTEVVNDEYGNESTALKVLGSILDDDWSRSEYPILLTNEILVQDGYPEIPTMNEETFDRYGACEDGRRFAAEYMEKLGVKELQWDLIVSTLRGNPSLLNERVSNMLVWWWDSVITDEGFY